MLLYEVTLEVEAGLAHRVEEHMRQSHIPAIAATGCFRVIRFCRSDAGRFRTTYQADNQADLDRYLRDYAPSLRAEFSREFPEGVSLAREIWVLREAWGQVLS
jgi:Domain of unknown function (DUF4286)